MLFIHTIVLKGQKMTETLVLECSSYTTNNSNSVVPMLVQAESFYRNVGRLQKWSQVLPPSILVPLLCNFGSSPILTLSSATWLGSAHEMLANVAHQGAWKDLVQWGLPSLGVPGTYLSPCEEAWASLLEDERHEKLRLAFWFVAISLPSRVPWSKFLWFTFHRE